MKRFLPSVLLLVVLNFITSSLSQTVVPLEEMKREESESLEEYGESTMLESFNRPEGTVALHVPDTGKVQTGITSGTYGSYRKQKDWIKAVSEDLKRHRSMHRNMNSAYPWLLNSMSKPSLVGFGMDGFWNSYAPNAAHRLYNLRAFSTDGVTKFKRM